MNRRIRRLAFAALGTLLVVSGCGDGSDADADSDLAPAAAEGRQVANSNGCAACHGSNGEGGVGPAWTGLFGSEVALDDGTTVIADEEYLRRSITDPRADVVDGFNLPMPENDLDDEEIAAVIEYIRALSSDAATGGEG